LAKRDPGLPIVWFKPLFCNPLVTHEIKMA
jgi:hypothetical protein